MIKSLRYDYKFINYNFFANITSKALFMSKK